MFFAFIFSEKVQSLDFLGNLSFFESFSDPTHSPLRGEKLTGLVRFRSFRRIGGEKLLGYNSGVNLDLIELLEAKKVHEQK